MMNFITEELGWALVGATGMLCTISFGALVKVVAEMVIDFFRNDEEEEEEANA